MILHGDSLQELTKLEPDSVDAVITDPPYGLSFMGKKWDYDVPSKELWLQVFRVLKPGGHALIACGTRTQHRQVVNVEDAGFEIRDVISHLYGSGFPKSLNVNKACGTSICGCKQAPEHELRPLRSSDLSSPLDAENERGQVLQPSVSEFSASSPVLRAESAQGAASREESGLEGRDYLQAKQGQLHRPEVRPLSETFHLDGPEGWLHNGASASDGSTSGAITNEDRSSASQGPQHSEQLHNKPGIIPKQSGPQTCGSCGKPQIADGLGTALKPACEFWTLARKPLSESTVAKNVLRHGTGAINVDAGRIASPDHPGVHHAGSSASGSLNWNAGEKKESSREYYTPQGRWPSNVLLDEEAAAMLDEQSGQLHPSGNKNKNLTINATSQFGIGVNGIGQTTDYKDSGGASRFFYVAKASKRERNAGLEGMPERTWQEQGYRDNESTHLSPRAGAGRTGANANHHPTVKPIKLMEYLCKLICPPNGVVLDPFMGSGSTGVAAKRLGFEFVGIERESEYVEIARKRIEYAAAEFYVDNTPQEVRDKIIKAAESF